MSDLEEKQKLIQDEIIEKKFTEYEFQEFVLKKTKKEAFDLAAIPVKELKELIADFKKQAKDKGTDIGSTMDSLKAADASTMQTTTTLINCKKLEKSPLNDKEVVVIIKNPKIVEAGIFQQNYVNYEVETAVVGWLVRRRYSDFEWLRTVLAKFHPGYVLPPLPSKKMSGRRFETDFIQKRMASLQKFIDTLSLNEYIKATEPLNAFLQITDRNQFEAKMKELSSYQPSPFIEESKTFTGNLTISAEEDENEKYYANISKYFQLQTQLYDRLNGNLKSFYTNFGTACKNLEAVTEDLNLIHLLNSKISMKEEITRTFDELAGFMKNWGRIMYKQNVLVKSHIKDFFKYVKHEGLAYLELIKSRDDARMKYITESTRLNAKKEKLWQANDVSKWEIVDEFNKVDKALLTKEKSYGMSKMCTKETTVVENMKKQLGFLNKMGIDELKVFIDIHAKKFMMNTNQFSQDFYTSLTDAISVYSSLQMFVAQFSV
jgi:sorting nexin-7/30/sorting nexin-8